jgi:hypothetical protein
MFSKINAGILSGIGLITVNLLYGFLLIPDLNLLNFMMKAIIIQVGFFWFSISIWFSLKYVLVDHYRLIDLRKNITWIISNLALACGLGLMIIIFPIKELYVLIAIVSTILFINYLILFKKIYYMDKFDLKYINDLHNYLISFILIMLILFLLNIPNEILWHKNIDYLDHFLSVIPIVFLIKFFRHVKLDLKNNQNACA